MPILNYKGEDGQFHSLGGLLKGDPGNAGVVVGDTEPTDPNVKVWINSAGDPMTAEQIPVSSTDNSSVATALGNKVPSSRTINGKHLNSDVVLSASDLKGAAADSNKLGGKDPKYYIQPYNLLDNSDFTNPVNQRGITTFSETSGYWLDRWVETRCSIDLTANTASVAEGTANNGYFYQRMPRIDDGKELTFAIKIGDDLFVASGNIQEGSASTAPLLLETAWGGLKIYSVNDLSIAMVYINAGNTISLPVWAALYEGTYTADTLPPYVPKGYAAELAECQRYFVVLSGNLIGIAHPYTTNDVYMMLYMPTKMRRKPTVELIYLRISNSNYITDSDASISSVDNMSIHNTSITFFANTSSTLTLGRLYGVSTTGGVYISADL